MYLLFLKFKYKYLLHISALYFEQPPEVYQERAHFWSDVWSLGGTLVEWFTFQSLWFIPQGQSDSLKVMSMNHSGDSLNLSLRQSHLM